MQTQNIYSEKHLFGCLELVTDGLDKVPGQKEYDSFRKIHTDSYLPCSKTIDNRFGWMYLTNILRETKSLQG